MEKNLEPILPVVPVVRNATSVPLKGRNAASERFLKNVLKDYGVFERTEWQNNNQTLKSKRSAYVVDLDNIKKKAKLGPKDIIEKLFNYNKADGTNLTCVPVAGWSVPKGGFFNCGEQVLEAYAKSFSLNPDTSPDEADIILRMSSKTHKRKIINNQRGEKFLRVSGNDRITDVEQFLAENRLVFFPEMPTLHSSQ